MYDEAHVLLYPGVPPTITGKNNVHIDDREINANAVQRTDRESVEQNKTTQQLTVNVETYATPAKQTLHDDDNDDKQ